MGTGASSVLARWANFYVIVGSSAGALTGLQFVVISLLAQTRAVGSRHELRAFGTPTVVHFCASLLVSAIMSAPWDSLSHLELGLGAFGAAGLVYSLMVIRHARTQTGYSADAGDWFWYAALPVLAYTTLTAEAILLSWNVEWCLFAVALTTLLFLVIGIHNAWDTVTYVALEHPSRFRGREE